MLQAIRLFLFALIKTAFALCLNILLFTFLFSEKIARTCQSIYGSFLVIATWIITPTTMVLSGPQLDALVASNEKIIVISNHLMYFDWWYMWLLAHYANRHERLKIVLKDDLKYIPLYGWAMARFGFIFLKRKWYLTYSRRQKDAKTLTRALEYCKTSSDPFWLLIFPEGTLLCDETKQWTLSYLAKEKLDYSFTNTLLPKHTGLDHAIVTLGDGVSQLFDVTLAYSD